MNLFKLFKKQKTTKGLASVNKESKPKFMELELKSGGTVLTPKRNIARLSHMPASEENRDTPTNPFPVQGSEERWQIRFEYGDNYDITANCYNMLKDTLEIVSL